MKTQAAKDNVCEALEDSQNDDSSSAVALGAGMAASAPTARSAPSADKPPSTGRSGAGLVASAPTAGVAGSALAASEERVNDKLNAITGIDFKQNIPVIKDTDPDWDRHWLAFKSILDCHNFGRKEVRPYDVLILLRKALPTHGPRLRIYTTAVDKARRSGKLPGGAQEVLDELQVRLRRVIRETEFQRQDRLDKEFEALTMGRQSHAEFQTQFEEKLMLKI